LLRLSQPDPPITREVWLILHPELRDLRRIRIATAWLLSIFCPK
jgi:hypothetical protein